MRKGWGAAGLFFVSLFSHAQTAPNGQLSPGFAACEPPIRLEEFYGINYGKIIDIDLNGNYLAIVGHYPAAGPGTRDLYPVWVQDLGADGRLTDSDFQIGVSTYYIATFGHPPSVHISKSGMLALNIVDETTENREFPDPNYTGPKPSAPMLPAPEDRMLVTCFAPVCHQTVVEVRRFEPIYHLSYTSPPYTNMQLDGKITALHWESIPGGGLFEENLVYSYVQYLNTLRQAPPWLAQAPNPMPPVLLPHTAIEKFHPWTGAHIPVAHHTTGGGQDGTRYQLALSAQTLPFTTQFSSYFASLDHLSLSLQGGNQAWSEVFVLNEDPTYPTGSTLWGTLTGIPSWEDGPASYLWAGRWQASASKSTVGQAHSLSNGVETLAVRTRFETFPITNRIRDAVFRSSLNSYAGQDLPVGPTNDGRDVTGLYAMDHAAAPGVPGLGTFTLAVETLPVTSNAPDNAQKRTQLFRYEPSATAGQVGSFAPYKEVVVPTANQVFYLSGAQSEHVWGTHDDYSLPTARVRNHAIARCP